MNEAVIDHTRPSYSAPQHNPRESHEQDTTTNQDSGRIRHAGEDSTDSDRWSQHMNARVPSRPPGELRSVDE